MKRFMGKLFLYVFFVLGSVACFLIPDSLSYGDAPITGTLTLSKPEQCIVSVDSVPAQYVDFDIKLTGGYVLDYYWGTFNVFIAAEEPSPVIAYVLQSDDTLVGESEKGNEFGLLCSIGNSSKVKVPLRLKVIPDRRVTTLTTDKGQETLCTECYPLQAKVRYKIYDAYSYDEKISLTGGFEKDVSFMSAYGYNDAAFGDMVRYKYSGKVGEKISVKTSITNYGNISEEKWTQPKIEISNVAYRPSGYSKNADQMWGIYTKATGHGSLEYTMEKWLESYDFYIDVYNPTYQGYAVYDNNGCGAISGSVPVRISITSDAKPSETPKPTPTPSKTKNRTSGCTPCAEMAGEPVQTGTGEYFTEPQVDISLGGPLPLNFVRYYASRLKSEGAVESALGDNWMHNFDLRLKDIAESSLDVVYSRGKIISFEKSGSEWKLKNAEETIYQLKKDSSGDFYLMDPSKNLVYHFDGTKGYLEEIKDRNENTLTLTRESSGKITEIADGLGRTLSFTHNSSGNLTKVSDGTRTLTYGYTDGVFTEFTDALGNTTTYVYDAENTKSGPLMTYTIYPGGNRHHIQTYDSKGRVKEQEDAFGNTYTFQYDKPKKGKSTVVDPLGNKTKSTYEEQKIVTETKDAMGKTADITYDDNNHPTMVTDKTGDTTSFSYHKESGKLMSMANAENSTASLSYTAQDQVIGGVTFTFYNLTRIDFPDGAHELYTYNNSGNLVTWTDKMGNIWTYTYSSNGQPLTETNPGGGVITYTYNSDGTLASRTDTDTGVSSYSYDSLKRQVKITHPDGTFRQTSFNQNDKITSITDEQGNTNTYTYDANGNLTGVKDALDNTISYHYDQLDRMYRTTDYFGKEWEKKYNELGYVSSTVDPLGNTEKYSYDERGRMTQVSDPLGNKSKIEYDDEGIPVSKTTHLGFKTVFKNDKLGYLTKQTDVRGNAATFHWDQMARLAGVTNSLGQKTSYTYDLAGRVTGVSGAAADTVQYERNKLGLLNKITDPNGNAWLLDYTSLGKLSSITDPLGNEWQYAYNKRGWLSGVTYPDGVTEAVSYDTSGNLTRRLLSEGTDLQYEYDALNNLASTNNISFQYDKGVRINDTQSSSVSFQAFFDDAGRLASVSYAGGLFTVNYEYDARGLLTRTSDTLTDAQASFSYDADGRMTAISRSNGVDTALAWDGASRNTRVQHGSIADLQYTYDAIGRVVRMDYKLPADPAGDISVDTSNFTYDAANQVNSSGYIYDKRGRLVSGSGHTFTWDGAGRLVGADAATLAYNGIHHVVSRTDGTATVQYYYNYALGRQINPIVAEKAQGSNTYSRFYVRTPGGLLLYMIDAASDNEVYFYHFDGIGSTLLLTNGEGKVTDSYAYTPYGRTTAHEGTNTQPFTFLGMFGARREDAAGALYQIGMRYYDATAARFISRDPNTPNIAGNTQQANPYNYAFNNPLAYVDVSGEEGGWVTWIAKKIFKKARGSKPDPEIEFAVESHKTMMNEFGRDMLLESEVPEAAKVVHGIDKIGVESLSDSTKEFAGGLAVDFILPLPTTALGNAGELYPPGLYAFYESGLKAVDKMEKNTNEYLAIANTQLEAHQKELQEEMDRLQGLKESLLMPCLSEGERTVIGHQIQESTVVNIPALQGRVTASLNHIETLKNDLKGFGNIRDSAQTRLQEISDKWRKIVLKK